MVNNQLIDDTLAYIRNSDNLKLSHRSRAADYVEWYLLANRAQIPIMAAGMLIAPTDHDQPLQKNARRAFYLLYEVISKKDGRLNWLPFPGIGMNGTVAVHMLPVLVHVVATVDDRRTGSNGIMTEDFTALEANPVAFMTRNKIVVAGKVKGVPENDRQIVPYYFSFDYLKNKHRFDYSSSPGAFPVEADCVIARYWTDIPGSYVKGGDVTHGDFSQLVGTKLGARVMVTTQFTGCAFAMTRYQGHVYCAHTIPKKPPYTSGFKDVVRDVTGTQLTKDVYSMNGKSGGFVNAPGQLAIYGAGVSYNTIHGTNYPSGLGGATSWMTIVGFPAGQDFHIFSQIMKDDSIISAQQIF